MIKELYNLYVGRWHFFLNLTLATHRNLRYLDRVGHYHRIGIRNFHQSI